MVVYHGINLRRPRDSWVLALIGRRRFLPLAISGAAGRVARSVLKLPTWVSVTVYTNSVLFARPEARYGQRRPNLRVRWSSSPGPMWFWLAVFSSGRIKCPCIRFSNTINRSCQLFIMRLIIFPETGGPDMQQYRSGLWGELSDLKNLMNNFLIILVLFHHKLFWFPLELPFGKLQHASFLWFIHRQIHHVFL